MEQAGFIDTHTHLFLEEFDEDGAEVMQRAREAGVSCVFMPNIDSTTLPRLLRTCDEYPDFCYPLIGLHPESVDGFPEIELELVRQQLLDNRQRYIGIGEIGIDLYWDDTFKEQQIEAFRTQVAWALEFDLPIVVHCRRAFPYIYKVLREFDENRLRGIFHCFTAEGDETEGMLEFPHMLLGINGISTFKKSPIPEALKRVPVERVVVETDAPYLAPVPKRGKRNESAFVAYTLRHLAAIYGVSEEEMARQTTKNALREFNFVPKCMVE